MTDQAATILRVALVRARRSGAHLSGQGSGPPLGLLSLAAYARAARPGSFAFEVHDTYFFAPDETARWLGRFAPNVVALSGLTVDAEALAQAAGLVRATLGPLVPVLLGGPHASAYPEACLAIPGVTAVVAGEGEAAFLDLLEHAAGRLAAAAVRGAWWRDAAGLVLAPAPLLPLDVTTLPTPAYDLVDVQMYASIPNTVGTILLPPHRYLPLFLTRGCPYHCTYCHNIFGRRFRALSVERVVDLVHDLSERYGVTHFHFYDDVFNAERARFLAVWRELARRRLGLRFYFANGLRFDTLDREQLEAMKEAGVAYVAAAIESASPRLQASLKKRVKLPKLLANVDIADEIGLFTTGFMMLGFPDETRDEMELTIRTAAESRLHYVYFSVLNPYEGTPLGAELRAQGVDVSADEMVGYSSPGKNFAGLPPDEFRELLRSAYRRFWTPSRFVAFLARHPDPAGFFEGLATPASRANLVRRTLSVLGVETANGHAPAAWVAPAPAHPLTRSLARWAGGAGGGLARALHGVVGGGLHGR